MWKNCNAVMLPSEKKANKGEFIISQYVKDKSLHCGIKVWESEIEEVNQHLYITSDEEIKDGDWYYTAGLNMIFQATCFPLSCKDAKKIIATTDTSLKFHHFTKGVFKDLEYSLHQIPKQFIQYFIEEYNKGNVITNVEVEYEEFKQYSGENGLTIIPSLIINHDNNINIKPIKDSWSRDEVIVLIKKVPNYYNVSIPIQESLLNKWIEENL